MPSRKARGGEERRRRETANARKAERDGQPRRAPASNRAATARRPPPTRTQTIEAEGAASGPAAAAIDGNSSMASGAVTRSAPRKPSVWTTGTGTPRRTPPPAKDGDIKVISEAPTRRYQRQGAPPNRASPT